MPKAIIDRDTSTKPTPANLEADGIIPKDIKGKAATRRKNAPIGNDLLYPTIIGIGIGGGFDPSLYRSRSGPRDTRKSGLDKIIYPIKVEGVLGIGRLGEGET